MARIEDRQQPLGGQVCFWIEEASRLRVSVPGFQPKTQVVLTLVSVAALASFWPAYRASRFDPVQALRYD